MRFTADDYRILFAALGMALQEDDEAWEDLTSDEMDRATELYTKLGRDLEEEEDLDEEEEEDD